MNEGKRPTKLKIDGGPEGEGMDMDMPPAPPMDQPPMDQPPMDDPMAGGDGMAPEPSAPEGGEDDELMNLFNGLSIEDKAAAKKYIESMADKGEGEGAPQEPPMATEGRIVRTTMREMLGSVALPKDERKTERDEEKLPKKFTKQSPFVTPY